MNTTRLLLCLAALIAVTSACVEFLQPLHGPLAYPQYTITFEDIPAGSLPDWGYYWWTPYVGIGQAFGAVADGAANFWDSNTTWFDQPYRPNHFHTLYADYLDYIFDPPIRMFSAKIRATTSSTPVISLTLVNGTVITGGSIASYSVDEINRYDYYGYNSSVPVLNVRITGGAVNVDDFQFNTVCPTGEYTYNRTTEQCIDVDECAAGTYVCDPNAYCINTVGSYKCHCNANYEGDGKTCSSYFTAINVPLTDAQDTITFEDVPLGTLPIWNYYWMDNSTHVALGQNTAAITNGVANGWDGAAPWFDQPTVVPGQFYVMYSDYADFFFNPPIKSFSAKMRATAGVPSLHMTTNGTVVDGVEISYYSDVNQHGYYGYSTSYPISNVRVLGGSVNIDDFQFVTMCADLTGTYDIITNTCA